MSSPGIFDDIFHVNDGEDDYMESETSDIQDTSNPDGTEQDHKVILNWRSLLKMLRLLRQMMRT
jgi:hypothetical protein